MSTSTTTTILSDIHVSKGPSRLSALPLVVPAILLLILGFATPVVLLVNWSLGDTSWSFDVFSNILADRGFWSILGYTFVTAIEVTVLSCLFAYPIAYIMLRASPRVRSLIAIMIIVPVWTSILVRSFAWMVLLGRRGVVNETLMTLGITDAPLSILYTHAAVVIGLVHVMLPYVVFPLFGAMQRIDPRLVTAATGLGASRTTAFFSIFLPLSLPGISAGGLLVLIMTLGAYITPAMLGGTRDATTVMLVEKNINLLANWSTGSALAILLLIATLIAVFLWNALFRMSKSETSREDARASTIGRWVPRIVERLSFLEGRAGSASIIDSLRRYIPNHVSAWVMTFVTLAFVVVPIILLVPISFSGAAYLQFPPPSYSLRWYNNYFSRSDWLNPTFVSIQLAIITTLISVPVGTMAAIGIARGRFYGRGACLAVLTAPAMTPHLVIAVGLYFQFTVLGMVGSLQALVVGHLMLAIPLVVIVVLGAMRRVDEAPERAARSLGASPITAFVKITLPSIRPSILAAAFFAFLASFDDVVMALFLSGTSTQTLPKRMWDGIVHEVDPTLAAASTLLILVTVLSIVAVNMIDSKALTSER